MLPRQWLKIQCKIPFFIFSKSPGTGGRNLLLQQRLWKCYPKEMVKIGIPFSRTLLKSSLHSWTLENRQTEHCIAYKL